MSLLDTLDKIGGSNTPAYTLKIDGVDITGKVNEKLLSLTLTDNRGFEADQLEIELDDSDGSLMPPRRGASASPWLSAGKIPARSTKGCLWWMKSGIPARRIS